MNYLPHVLSTTHRGFGTLLAMIVISGVTVSLGLALLHRGITRSQQSLALEHAAQAQLAAGHCAEEALSRLVRVFEYAGNETLVSDTVLCTIHPISGSGNTNRIVDVESTVATYTTRLRVTVAEVSPVLRITSFVPVATF